MITAQRNSLRGRNASIHGLRGVLAFLVFVFHVAHSGLPGYGNAVLDFLLLSCEFGVELFFGISGIVIVLAWHKTRRPSDFLYDRATRIFPVLWASVLTITVLGQFQADKEIPSGALIVLANLLAMPPVFPVPVIHPAAWSISYEFAFYGMFVLFALCQRIMPVRLALVVVLFAGFLLLTQHVRGLCFLGGVMIAAGWLNRPIFQKLSLPSGTLIFSALFFWQLTKLQLPRGAHDFHFITLINHPGAGFCFLLGAMLATLGLLGVFREQGLFVRLLLLRPMQFLGTISFSFYLWQTVTMAIVKKGMGVLKLPELLGGHSQFSFGVLSLPPTLIVSYVSYALLEVRVTRWLRSLRHPDPGR